MDMSDEPFFGRIEALRLENAELRAELVRVKLHTSAWEDSARINKDRAEAAERQLAELAARSGALTQDAVAWLGEGAGFKSFTYKKTVADRWLKDGLAVTPVATLHPAARSGVPEGWKEALEFYADPANWVDTPSWDGDPECVTPKAIPVIHGGDDGSPCDCGDTARKALSASPAARSGVPEGWSEMLETLQRIDAWWLVDFPEGPDGSRDWCNGLGQLSDDTIELWRSIRSAISKASPAAVKEPRP